MNDNSNERIKPLKRDMTFDIARAILIILVVLGHSTKFNLVYQVIIYWFHMPAFFILSGLFYRDRGENILIKFLNLLKKYYMPMWIYYFIIALYQNRLNKKDILKNLYGGNMATESVFWFPTVLLLTIFTYSILKSLIKSRWIILPILIMYLLAHLESIYLIPEHFTKPLPWAWDIVLIAIFYFFIGDNFNTFIRYLASNKNIYLSLAIGLISSILIFLQIRRGNSSYIYVLNMKNGNYSHYFLDLLPVLFTFFVFIISNLISRINTLNKIMALIGKNSQAIMYLHIALLIPLELKGLGNLFINIIIVLIISILFSYLYNFIYKEISKLKIILAKWYLARIRLLTHN